MITKPALPPRPGYVEVEIGGERLYRNAATGVLMRDEVPESVAGESVWDELDAAYQGGVNSVD